jgi:hypothetical protein
MFEHHTEPLLDRIAFLKRVARHSVAGIGLLAGSLGVGIVGFHTAGGLSWINSLVDASMLLGGMGPVYSVNITRPAGKIFASVYALFAGIVFLIAMGVILAPVIHRFLHKFHHHAQQ